MRQFVVVCPAAAYGPSGTPRGRRLAQLAGRQHGVVSLEQLHALGYSDSAVRRAVARGHLHRLHRGVYAVGHRRISRRGHWLAAVLASGPEAVLSHRTAGALWELRSSSARLVDVSAPGHFRRTVSGVRCHALRHLNPADVTTLDGIPVTSVERTLLDLAALLSSHDLRRALEEAERRERVDGRALHALLARSRGRRGVRALRQELAAMGDHVPWTRSELEDAFLMLIRRSGLPEPQCNVLVHGELVDCWWPRQRLVVELDSYRYHRTRASFESDRRRDTKLQLHEVRVLRFTFLRIHDEPDAVRSEVARMLGRG